MVDGLATCFRKFSVYVLVGFEQPFLGLVCQSSYEDFVAVVIVGAEHIFYSPVGCDGVCPCLISVQCVLGWEGRQEYIVGPLISWVGFWELVVICFFDFSWPCRPIFLPCRIQVSFDCVDKVWGVFLQGLLCESWDGWYKAFCEGSVEC